MRKICRRLNNSSFLLASAALLVSASTIPASSQSRINQSPRPILAAEQCQPLSEQNYEICCVALNRNDILTANQLDECPPLTTSLVQQAVNNFNDSPDGNDTDNPGTLPDNPNNPGNPPDSPDNPGNPDDPGNPPDSPDDPGDPPDNPDNPDNPGNPDDPRNPPDSPDDPGDPPDNPDNPDAPNDPSDSSGNPGNDKDVGKAGEGPGPHSDGDFGPTGSRGRGG